MSRKKPTNYLNNKDMLAEIHKSKSSYCEFEDFESQHAFDYIVQLSQYIKEKKVKGTLEITVKKELEVESAREAVEKIIRQKVQTARENRAKRLAQQAYQEALAIFQETEGAKLKDKPKQAEFQIDPDSIPLQDLVFRVVTYEHIPLVPDRKKNPRKLAELHKRVSFIPFKHYMFNEKEELVEVGRSHSKDGKFCDTHGAMTPKLANMLVLLVNRYSQRSNWRGYCVDDQTEALTQRGWLSGDQITESDRVLSCNENRELVWSKIHHLFKDHYVGNMHHVTSKQGLSMLVTPQHKLVTEEGLRPMELIRESDRVILMGSAEQGNKTARHSDELVELAGWIVTEGNYERDKKGIIKRICVWQNDGLYAERIRNCLTKLNYQFSESVRGKNICFKIFRDSSKEFEKVLPEKNLNMDFILDLTLSQRELLFETLIDGDGWRRGKQSSYAQKCEEHVAMFQSLCTLLGKRSTSRLKDIVSFQKETQCHVINVFSERKNKTRGEHLDFNGGKVPRGKQIGLGKETHPNVPTVPYDGLVWCVQTDHGSFVVRRNGNVYLTGNSYCDEMRGQALLQLSRMGLQFDEAKSQNPFAYFTTVVSNSFTKILHVEKKQQVIRDDLLEEQGKSPSFTRQLENDEHIKTMREQAEEPD